MIPATKFGRMWMIEPADAEAFAQQWKPNRTNGHVKHTNALYRCFDAGGALLYIGGTTDLAIRVVDEGWWREVAEIRVENGFVTPEEMAAAGRAAVSSEHPTHGGADAVSALPGL